MGTAGSKATPSNATTIKEHELEQVSRANKTGLQAVVFVHGLWLLPSSWDRWAALFEKAGFTVLTPGGPDDPETVAERMPIRKFSHIRRLARWRTTSTKSSGC